MGGEILYFILTIEAELHLLFMLLPFPSLPSSEMEMRLRLCLDKLTNSVLSLDVIFDVVLSNADHQMSSGLLN